MDRCKYCHEYHYEFKVCVGLIHAMLDKKHVVTFDARAKQIKIEIRWLLDKISSGRIKEKQVREYRRRVKQREIKLIYLNGL